MAVLVYSSAHDRSVLPCRLSPISVPPLRFPSPAPSCLKSPTWAYHQQHHPFTICTTTGDTAGPGVVDQPACDGHLPQPNAHRSSAAAVLALTTHALGRRRRRWSCCISSMLRRNADHTYTDNAPRNKTIPKWKLNNGHLKASPNMLTAGAAAPAVKPPAPAVESKLWHCGGQAVSS